MTDLVIIKHGNPEKQHDWNKYVCPYCECEFIADGILYACPECSHMLTVEAKKAHITDKEARKIMAKDITMNCCPEEREKMEDECIDNVDDRGELVIQPIQTAPLEKTNLWVNVLKNKEK